MEKQQAEIDARTGCLCAHIFHLANTYQFSSASSVSQAQATAMAQAPESRNPAAAEAFLPRLCLWQPRHPRGHWVKRPGLASCVWRLAASFGMSQRRRAWVGLPYFLQHPRRPRVAIRDWTLSQAPQGVPLIPELGLSHGAGMSTRDVLASSDIMPARLACLLILQVDLEQVGRLL